MRGREGGRERWEGAVRGREGESREGRERWEGGRERWEGGRGEWQEGRGREREQRGGGEGGSGNLTTLPRRDGPRETHSPPLHDEVERRQSQWLQHQVETC